MTIASSIADFLNETTSARAEETLALLGEAGYQLYMTDGETVRRFGGHYRDETIDDAVIRQVLDGKVYNGIRVSKGNLCDWFFCK